MAGAQISHEHDIFNYTSGRWVYNEKKRLAERHLHFNDSALLEAAAQSINRSKADIKSFRKLSEGGFNRVFEICMRDGKQIIARLPYPCTQPKCLATASAVATMDLVRRHGVPTPLVYAYSADGDNAVGSEYIIMEKAAGRRLGDTWYELSDKQRLRVLDEIVDQEVKLLEVPLPAYGSVYYTKDMPSHMGWTALESEAGRFCVGPDVSLKYWYGTRSQLDVPRRSATTSLQVLVDGAKKELAWLHAFGRSRLPFDREYREMLQYQKVDPGDHIQNLEQFLKVAEYIVPSEDWLQRPFLRHPDLNMNNIFIDDDCKITSIIDWQHATVLPLFLQAGIPHSLQNYGDPDSEELKKPQYPSNLDDLDEDDREKDLELYRRRHAHFYYVAATAAKLKTHYKAMAQDRVLFRKKLYNHAVEPWEGNSIPLKADLVMLTRDWSEFTRAERAGGEANAVACPIAFEEQDAKATMEKIVEQEDIDQKMDIVRNYIGVGTDGWVSCERYEGVVDAVKEMKVEALGDAETDFEREGIEEHWPWDDFDEDV